MKWVRVPVIEPLNPVDVWEHTPLDYARYGEYPRFIRPIGPRAGDHKTKWVRAPDPADCYCDEGCTIIGPHDVCSTADPPAGGA